MAKIASLPTYHKNEGVGTQNISYFSKEKRVRLLDFYSIDLRLIGVRSIGVRF